MVDDEGYLKTMELWTKEDGSIKMHLADGFGKENTLRLLRGTIESIEKENTTEGVCWQHNYTNPCPVCSGHSDS